MIKLGPRCMYCKHYNRKDPGTCMAFPQGIPGRFIVGTIEHLTSYEGDHGIQFELDPKLTADSLRNYKDQFEKQTQN